MMAQKFCICQVAWLPSGSGSRFAMPSQIGRFILRIQGPIAPLRRGRVLLSPNRLDLTHTDRFNYAALG